MFKKIVLPLVIFILLTDIIQDARAEFTDVTLDHPQRKAIDFVEDQGIVKGYADGTYQPKRLLNRAEFTKIIIEAIYNDIEINACVSSSEDKGSSGFSDIITGIWFEKYVCLAKKHGIISGYPDGTFRPTQ